ncbi:helix-turn-helix domain-containing protein [Micromonospora chersina]|uniref:helix-turn-helix domain-containing protein n=1 Tax=Micromonospora chersina TaxID=47854 RepID=UPI003718E3CC
MSRMPMLELFAGELRRLRGDAGLSQEALGERVNYSASLVAAVEQCRRPPREEFAQRCDEALRAPRSCGSSCGTWPTSAAALASTSTWCRAAPSPTRD